MTKLLPGVYCIQKKDKTLLYRASLTFRRRHVSLGSYPDEASAHKAYLDGWELLRSKKSPEDYGQDKKTLLSFEKWVVLTNFRDNGLYLSTPIYLRKNYFQYYLTQTLILKFDIDDLFYYTSHKIMSRGGHLFVADYGMQVNIKNRYGIKSHAVAGRDYRFINGDETDFRYVNLEIINRYYGVLRITRNFKPFYKVRLHLRSNYVVGVYETEAEAAIAYNKAVDIVRKNGINRNFTPNYIEGLSAAAYADLYAQIPISEKILTLTPCTVNL